MNDGYVDARGRFWAGTWAWAACARRARSTAWIPTAGAPHAGARLDLERARLESGQPHVLLTSTWRSAASINSISSPNTGAIRNRRPFVEFPTDFGYPDGLIVDAEGFVWVGALGGRIAASLCARWPARRDRPSARVADRRSARSADQDLTDLYVTTAWVGLDAAARAEQPQAGGLFRVRPGVRGKKVQPVRRLSDGARSSSVDVHKSFGAVQALRGVSFRVAAGRSARGGRRERRGKIHAAEDSRGHHAARCAARCGWTTRPFDHASPREALAGGIGMVFQERLAFPESHASPRTSSPGARSRAPAAGSTKPRCARARASCSLTCAFPIVRDLRWSTPRRRTAQLVQVARALAFDCRVLVLDEPTTSLTDAEVDHLFRILDELKARGVTMLFVSHRLPEVFRLCDRITVLRDGAHAGTFERAATTPEAIVRAMVGREPPARVGARWRDAARRPVLSVQALSRAPAVPRRVVRCARRAKSSASSASSDRAARSCWRRSSALRSRRAAAMRRRRPGRRRSRLRATRCAPASRSCPKIGSGSACTST